MSDETTVELTPPKAARTGGRGVQIKTSCDECRRKKIRCTHVNQAPEKGQPAGSGVPSVEVGDVTPPARPAVPSQKPQNMTELRRAEATLKATLQGLFDIAADVWEDPLLKVPDAEADPWAASTARAIEQLGWLPQVQKIAPAEALARTGSILLPRARRVAMKRPARPAGRPRAQFTRPPGMTPHEGGGPPASNGAAPAPTPPQSIGEGFDRPYNPADPTIA